MDRNKSTSPKKGRSNKSPKKGKKDDEKRSLLSKDRRKDEDNDEKPPPVPLNYAFLDGLRGFGALAVYFSHFFL